MKNICLLSEDQDSYAPRRFQEEASSLGLNITFTRWSDLYYDSEQGKIFTQNDSPLESFSGIILRGDNTSLTPLNLITSYCRHNDIPLLNEHFYFKNQTTNKLRQAILFQSEDIASLRTIYGEHLDFSFLKENLGLPFVAKLTHGSLGLQVFKIESKGDFLAFLEQRRIDKEQYLFQRYYPIQSDYRVMIIGDESFGAVRRIPRKGEWKTNLSGSTHERAEEMADVLFLAQSLGKKTRLEFAGVDILIDSLGNARVIEINTMAQFKVFEKVFPEINVARKTLLFLQNKIKEKNKSHSKTYSLPE